MASGLYRSTIRISVGVTRDSGMRYVPKVTFFFEKAPKSSGEKADLAVFRP
jgi:hypothetical protein